MTIIGKVGVIGSGVMGAGIAGQLANGGIDVELLDIVPDNATDRDGLAKGAIARMLKTEPAPLMSPRNAKRIRPGNLQDHWQRLGDCDWIIEAVLEIPEIKQAVYRQVEAVRKDGSIVSSNTSTIPLEDLTRDMPPRFTQDFLVTHFFNPPRYMRLLELVDGPKTRPAVVEAIRDFGDRVLGKTVVHCRDTPGFIANRIGVYWNQVAINATLDLGLTVEQADLVNGRPLGFPKTGIFGLLDLVGIDLGPHVAESLLATLPMEDAYRDAFRDWPLMTQMIAEGYTGRKGKGGFYRLRKEGGQRIKEAIDLETGNYRPVDQARFESVDSVKRGGLQSLLGHEDPGGRYAWTMLSQVLCYAADLAADIADDITGIDAAMRDGYAWKGGPFELLDRIGPAWFADRLRAEGRPVPALIEQVGSGTFYRIHDGRLQYFGFDGAYHDIRRADGVLLLADVKRGSAPLARNGSASLWDIGDGVVCLEFHTKMNALDADTVAMIETALRLIPEQGHRALVIHNEASNFSVGANLGLVLFAANLAMWHEIERQIEAGQNAFGKLKFAPFPVVGAPSGMALGGGCEILLHCDAIQAHAETYMGLVEVGVGVIPGWGGCTELLLRWSAANRRPGGPMPPVIKTFETISAAQVAKSAQQAREMMFLAKDDGITMNRDRVLADAKARALDMAEGYTPPTPAEITLPGPTGKAAMAMAVRDFHKMGKALDHDVTVSLTLATVLSGDDTDLTRTVTEDRLRQLERRAFLALLHEEKTLNRMEHMLETGRPLRN